MGAAMTEYCCRRTVAALAAAVAVAVAPAALLGAASPAGAQVPTPGGAGTTTTSTGPRLPLRDAVDLGDLLVVPAAAARIEEPFVVRTSAGSGCPAASAATWAYLIGPAGRWADPAHPVATVAPAALPAGPPARSVEGGLAGVAAGAGLGIVPGTYRLVLQCGSLDQTDVNGEYDAAIQVRSDGTWQSSPFSATTGTTTPTPILPVPTGAAVEPPPPTAGVAGPTTSAGPTSIDPTSADPSVASAPTADASSGGVPASADTASGGLPREGEAAGATSPSRVFLDASTVLGTLKVAGRGDVFTAGADIKLTLPVGGACPAGAVGNEAFFTGPSPWPEPLSVSQKYAPPRSGDFDLGSSIATMAGRVGFTIVPGKYTFSVACYADLDGIEILGQFVGNVWFVDTTTWQTTDPATSQTTTRTTMTTAPLVRMEQGASLTLTARVEPANAAGSVRFQQIDNSGGMFDFPPVTAPTPPTSVPVTNGTATFPAPALPVGLYYFSAKFIPTDSARFTESQPTTYTSLAVVPPAPPTPTGAATLSGTPAVGQTLTCAAAFTGATSTAWAWIRDYDTVLEPTTSTYTVVAADKGHSLRCRSVATNAGGAIGRTSPAVQVPA